ncbi:hypothetical protein ASG54_22850 [Aureimonas sp. Leaf460]|nr:hypothetical protein ASG62_24515 [Aureimonas sp. Leaf427]KQT63948.1 hypothetical protein ASG54_22850 [Aureimonas sp. Leaf460]
MPVLPTSVLIRGWKHAELVVRLGYFSTLSMQTIVFYLPLSQILLNSSAVVIFCRASLAFQLLFLRQPRWKIRVMADLNIYRLEILENFLLQWRIPTE